MYVNVVISYALDALGGMRNALISGFVDVTLLLLSYVYMMFPLFVEYSTLLNTIVYANMCVNVKYDGWHM